MRRLIVAVEGLTGGPEAVVRLDGTGAEWRCRLPDYDAATAAALRWILEDYPRLMPSESRRLAKVLAHAKLFAFGGALHDAVFGADEQRVCEFSVPLPELDVVVHDSTGLTRHWPWELMNSDGAAVVHNSRSFIRRVTSSVVAASTSKLAGTGPLRVLMVISRPAGVKDIPFRTVASRVLRAVAGRDVEIEVLRPPTLAALESRLSKATRSGEPFHVVHFDGHGGLVNTPRGMRGALSFEKDNASQLVTGARIAHALTAGDVPVLLLNACRSAQAPVAQPRPEDPPSNTSGVIATASLAEEVATTGIEVVAMSHMVHVATAAHIVTDMYSMLAVHRDVADAVRFARRRWLDDSPAIDVAEGYTIVRHFGQPVERRGSAPKIDYPEMRGRRTPAHPQMPAEFQGSEVIVGTDDAVLTLEQRLRHGGLVEIRGLRGSGKTTLLLEFGRWLVATRGAEPGSVHYVDLAHQPLGPVLHQLDRTDRQVVLLDNARVVPGDPLRGLAAWDAARVASLRDAIDALISAGGQVIVATCAPLLDIDEAQRMSMLPLELDELRQIAATQTRGELEVPDLALLWTGGNPGSVEFMVNWARGGHLATPTKTWQTLRDLGLGAFEQAPLPVPADSPLVLSAPEAIFHPAYLTPWVVAQCPTRMTLDADVVKAFSPDAFRSQLLGATAPGAFATLEQAGLVCRTDDCSYDVHPLTTCLIITPVTTARSATAQHWMIFKLVAQFAAHMKVWQLGAEGGALLHDVRDPIASLWWLPSLIQSWRYMGELAEHHGLYLALGRQIRERLLDAQLGDYWNLAFTDMQKIFDKTPLGTSPEGHQDRLQWLSLQTLEAKRAGDATRELTLAREAAALSAADSHTQMVDAFDAQMKLGRAEREPLRKRLAFERAIQVADKDISRVAVAELELTRILRTEVAIRDLARAREYGESALGHFRGLQAAGLLDPTRIVEAALSLSLVYFDLFRTGHDESGVAVRRGVALCEESLSQAMPGIHKANAAYDLGLWRLWLGDPAEAERLLLTALSAYDALGESEHLQNLARYFRLKAIDALLSQGVDRAIEARLLAVDLLPRLLADPEAPDDWKLETYRIGVSLGAAKHPLPGASGDGGAANAAASEPKKIETASEPDGAETTSARPMTTRELAEREPGGSLPEQTLSRADLAQLFELAEQAHRDGDLDAARDILHGLIVLDRQSSSAWASLGRVEKDAGLLEDARAAFAFAVGLEPDNAELATELARVDQAVQEARRDCRL